MERALFSDFSFRNNNYLKPFALGLVMTLTSHKWLLRSRNKTYKPLKNSPFPKGMPRAFEKGKALCDIPYSKIKIGL